MKNCCKQSKKIYLGVFFWILLTSFFLPSRLSGQEIVDRTVAVVDDNFGMPELITYSDLIWALAMIPDVPISPPGSEDLNRALQLLINQRLIAIEAKRLPGAPPTEGEIDEEIKRVLAGFSSTAEFEKRLRLVGFESVKDDNFERIMEERVKIEKYLDFRFRSFVVITAEDENRYYYDVFVPDFRRRFPGRLMPSLAEKRAEINQILTEEKVASEIENFLDEAKRRTTITILSEI
jgi:hypothetical protein